MTAEEVQLAVAALFPGQLLPHARVMGIKHVKKFKTALERETKRDKKKGDKAASATAPGKPADTDKAASKTVAGKKKEKKKDSQTEYAGLVFNVKRVAWLFAQGWYAPRVSCEAHVCMAAVLEYIAAEILELGGNEAINDGVKAITPSHIHSAIRGDDELAELVNLVGMAIEGVYPSELPLLLRVEPRHDAGKGTTASSTTFTGFAEQAVSDARPLSPDTAKMVGKFHSLATAKVKAYMVNANSTTKTQPASKATSTEKSAATSSNRGVTKSGSEGNSGRPNAAGAKPPAVASGSSQSNSLVTVSTIAAAVAIVNGSRGRANNNDNDNISKPRSPPSSYSSSSSGWSSSSSSSSGDCNNPINNSVTFYNYGDWSRGYSNLQGVPISELFAGVGFVNQLPDENYGSYDYDHDDYVHDYSGW